MEHNVVDGIEVLVMTEGKCPNTFNWEINGNDEVECSSNLSELCISTPYVTVVEFDIKIGNSATYWDSNVQRSVA